MTITDARTAQAFERLKEAAKKLELVDYGDLAAHIRVAPVGINLYLDAIYAFCRRNEYPELNVLAVSKGTGIPSKNLAPYGGEEKPANLQGMIYWCSEMIRVYSYDWSGVTYL